MLPSSLRWRVSILLLLVSAAIVTRSTIAQGPLTIAPNLRVRTDANGYLIATSGAYTGPDGPLTNFGNIRLRTDANGYLITTIQGDQSVPTGVALGSVFVSNGVAAAGVWSSSPTLTNAANTRLKLESTGGGNDQFIYLLNAASSEWSVGADGSDSGTLKFDAGSTPGSATKFSLTSGGVGTLSTSLVVGTTSLASGTAPTISSGFNTSPSVTNGGAFSFVIGTGTTASTNTGVIGLPTATNGWSCQGQDLSDAGYVNQVASTTTSASFKYYSRTTGLAINWPASVAIAFICGGR